MSQGRACNQRLQSKRLSGKRAEGCPVQPRTTCPIGCENNENNERCNEKSTRYDENNKRYERHKRYERDKRYSEYTQENNCGDRGDALHPRSDGIIGTGKLDDRPLADHEDLPGSKRGHDRWSREFNGCQWGLKDGSLADHEDSTRYRGPNGVTTGDQESSPRITKVIT
jgi:hypothetical protein